MSESHTVEQSPGDLLSVTWRWLVLAAASFASLWALGPTVPFMAATGAALGWNLVTTRRQWRHLAWDVRTVRAALPARVEVLVGRVIPRAEQVAEPARRALPVGRAA